MGLCKCPKKKVTNQFCFEHRVNVCEYCMVSNHPKCVVQSYLQWLKDSDYSPVCELCSGELNNEECIRLTCYHVYHINCLDSWARQLPPNTAPAGFSCPTCGTGIFPPANMVSPVVDALRNILSRRSWAREGLGLPMSLDNEVIISSMSDDSGIASPHSESVPQARIHNGGQASPFPSTPIRPVKNPGPPYSVVNVDGFNDGAAVYHRNDSVTPRWKGLVDNDDDKYKRKSVWEMLGRWFENALQQKGLSRKSKPSKTASIFVTSTGTTLNRCGDSSHNSRNKAGPSPSGFKHPARTWKPSWWA
nr:EOG090X0ASS [Lepidurus arcticus]